MATKITAALGAALVIGALMTSNHEALARAAALAVVASTEVVSAAEGSMEVVSAVVDSGSTADSDADSDLDTASEMDAASDFMVAIPTFMAGMDTAAVLLLWLLRLLLSSMSRRSIGWRSRRILNLLPYGPDETSVPPDWVPAIAE